MRSERPPPGPTPTPPTDPVDTDPADPDPVVTDPAVPAPLELDQKPETGRSASYQLEGLEDRILLRELLPNYAEKVNATIQMQIIVDPQGNVRSVTPPRKGNPQLEAAVMQALRRWRFNPLQPNEPQENQFGIVTFRFRLQ